MGKRFKRFLCRRGEKGNRSFRRFGDEYDYKLGLLSGWCSRKRAVFLLSLHFFQHLRQTHISPPPLPPLPLGPPRSSFSHADGDPWHCVLPPSVTFRSGLRALPAPDASYLCHRGRGSPAVETLINGLLCLALHCARV